MAYKVGVIVTGAPELPFAFEMSWTWLRDGLGAIWKPFLVGCAVTGTLLGLLGYALFDLLWRYIVRKRYRERAGGASRKSGALD
jgi:hypothetical protein